MRLTTFVFIFVGLVDLCFSLCPTIIISSRFRFAAKTLPPAAFVSSETNLFAASSDDDGIPKAPSRSRLEGNTRQPTNEEVAIMDEMITKLADAKPYELPNAVRRAFRVVSSPRFFLRIAERVDTASDENQKEKLSALATNLVNTLEAVVETTEEQLDEKAKAVEKCVKAAAEPDSGEFLVPLVPDRLLSMRRTLEGLDEQMLDEGFLSTVDSWMNKAHLDGLDLMVQILQTLLQMYAGTQIRRARLQQQQGTSSSSSFEAELFNRLLQVDTSEWEPEIKKAAKEVSPNDLKNEVQRSMEIIVLGRLESGSMAQQVQAQFLRELVTRIEKVQKTM